MGIVVDMAGPWSGWLPGSAFCSGCQLLVDGDMSWSWCWTRGGWSWVMKQLVRESLGVLWLVLAPWCVELGPRVADCGSRHPRDSVSLLMGVAVAQGGPRACVVCPES